MLKVLYYNLILTGGAIMTEEKIKEISEAIGLPVNMVSRLVDFGYSESDFFIMTGREMFHDLLEYDGISGYSGIILSWVNHLINADLLYFD